MLYKIKIYVPPSLSFFFFFFFFFVTYSFKNIASHIYSPDQKIHSPVASKMSNSPALISTINHESSVDTLSWHIKLRFRDSVDTVRCIESAITVLQNAWHFWWCIFCQRTFNRMSNFIDDPLIFMRLIFKKYPRFLEP